MTLPIVLRVPNDFIGSAKSVSAGNSGSSFYDCDNLLIPIYINVYDII